MSKRFTQERFGYQLVLGKFAKQAHGAAWLQQGGTVLLATVVSEATEEFPGFLPLTVDFREQFASAGRIPGGYFKREGKFTDKEVLTARLVDRSIRPRFPERFFQQVQVYIQLLSYDPQNSPTPLALVAASMALSLSPVPFMGPVGGVEVMRVNGAWVTNPNAQDRAAADVRIIVAGTKEGVCMVEGTAEGVSENELVDALFVGHEAIKEQVAWQESVLKEYGTAEKITGQPDVDWDAWQKRLDDYLTVDRVCTVCTSDKKERKAALQALRDGFFELYKEQIETGKVSEKLIDCIFDLRMKQPVTQIVFGQNKRIDGRAFDEVRSINAEVGLLPFAHGSSMFVRGGTQALATATLGSAQDELRTEEIGNADAAKSFILHYNFPPFSVGEVRPMRGPGRREVGHGNLAANALAAILPKKDSFPYTIRVVADILESDGSSSMATVCSSMLALMDTGVPVANMVSGVAMGLMRSPDGKRFQALTDITGFEDAFGLMDFKVAGTPSGVTAIQMDIKYKGGLERAVFEHALEQSRRGREHILKEMQKVLAQTRPELSPLVPKYVTFMIDTDKIGAVIGTGGKVIREIIEKTGTTIDVGSGGIEGKIVIFGVPGADIAKAENWVKVLAGQIHSGDRFDGTVTRHAEFGLFVELVPGAVGLLHVSAIPHERQRTMFQDYPIGSKAAVKVLDYDAESGRIRLAFEGDNVEPGQHRSARPSSDRRGGHGGGRGRR